MWLTPLLDLIFPPTCEVCRRRGPEALCPDCFSRITFMKPQLGVFAAAPYDGVVRTALHRLKFQKRKKLADPLGVIMVKYLSRTPELKMEEIDYLVPVPLHRQRQRERGYNQAELLALVISRYYEIPVSQALTRVKPTHPQFDLPREQRFANIKGAFRLTEPTVVQNKRVLLLDDIYTTGSTVAECAKILKAAGTRRVEILTLTRVVE